MNKFDFLFTLNQSKQFPFKRQPEAAEIIPGDPVTQVLQQLLLQVR